MHALTKVMMRAASFANSSRLFLLPNPVPLWIYGGDLPGKGRVVKNTDVGKYIAEALGGSLTRLERELYVDLDTTDLTYSVNVEDVTNEHAIIEGYVFPLNTDFFMNQDVRVSLPGITVYAPMTGKLYISSEAIGMVKDLMM